MTAQSMTTDRGILYVTVDDEHVLLNLNEDDGDVQIIEIPAAKFAAIVDFFHSRQLEVTP